MAITAGINHAIDIYCSSISVNKQPGCSVALWRAYLIIDTRINAAAMHLLSVKEKVVLSLPSVMYRDQRTNLAARIGDFP